MVERNSPPPLLWNQGSRIPIGAVDLGGPKTRVGYKHPTRRHAPSLRHCEPVRTLVWQSVFPFSNLFAIRSLRMIQDPFLFSELARKEKWFIRLAAFAFPGPVSRRPAKGAAAERRSRLILPQAAAALSAQREKSADAGIILAKGNIVPATVRLPGCNRGKRCRPCFRAEPLRLALPGAEIKPCVAAKPCVSYVTCTSRWRCIMQRSESKQRRERKRSLCAKRYVPCWRLVSELHAVRRSRCRA